MRPILVLLAAAVPRGVESCAAGEYLSTIQYCVDAAGTAVAGCSGQVTYRECCSLAGAGYYSAGGAIGIGVRVACPAGVFGSTTGLTTSACSGTCG